LNSLENYVEIDTITPGGGSLQIILAVIVIIIVPAGILINIYVVKSIREKIKEISSYQDTSTC
jgi:hypothetical protein